MSDPHDLFQMVDEAVGKDKTSLSLTRWEEQIVSRILKFYDLENEGAHLRNLCRERTGKAHLLFLYFIQTHPDFPVYMMFDKIPYLHEQSMEDWVERFTKTKLFERFQEAAEVVPEIWRRDKPLAMVFPSFNYMRTLCMTTDAQPMVAGHRRFDAMVDGVRYTFEPLEFFLKSHPWSGR